MPKFVLIDHSITEVGGHYYEYAVRVLRAAEQAGYEPILATNRKLGGIEPLPWRVVPAFRYGFFEPGPPRLIAIARRLKDDLRRRAARLKYRWAFSQLGVLWSKRRERAQPESESESPRQMAAAVTLETVPYLARIGLALTRCLLAVVPLGNYVRNVARAFRSLLAAALRPGWTAQGQGSQFWQQARFWRKRGAFGNDSLRLFRHLALDEGDVVFIPTLSEADMLGLVKLFHRNCETAKATWHMVFRRNIYHGREPDYAPQDESLRPLRNAFRRFQEELRGQRVFFYTDTEPLSIQYNRLGVARFRTVSIPVATDYQVTETGPTTGGDPRHVVYIGDARTEKGYHRLPQFVGDMRAAGPPVRFTFQSNYNVSSGEPAAVVARAQLEGLPPECKVELVTQPLSSHAYRRLLLAADVVVIPYDRDNYYARSSGIFAEALVAGKPLIVPAGTWMATELATTICNYHQSVREQHRIVAGFDAIQLVWKTSDSTAPTRKVPADPLAIRGTSPSCCWLKVPADATHLLVSFRLASHGRGVFPGIAAEQFGRGRLLQVRNTWLVGGGADRRGSALVPLREGVRRVRLGLSNSLSMAPITLEDVRIEYIQVPRAIPLSAVGAVYTEPNELSLQLREILAHYDHYRLTAAKASRHWAAYLNPNTLLQQLLASHGECEVQPGATAGVVRPPIFDSSGEWARPAA